MKLKTFLRLKDRQRLLVRKVANDNPDQHGIVVYPSKPGIRWELLNNMSRQIVAMTRKYKEALRHKRIKPMR